MKTKIQSKVTTYEYDSRNLQTKIIYPDHVVATSPGNAGYGIIECSYDASGRKEVCTDQKGETVTYNYDSYSSLL